MQDFFQHERAAGRPLVAAIVLATDGSTYRKPGARMLFAASGERTGLLSGGCLEADLRERALRLLAPGATARLEIASYDSRGSDDPVWGLGLGCEGLMRILLLRIDAASGYEPLAFCSECEAQRRPGAYAVALRDASPDAPAGRVWHSGMTAARPEDRPALDACAARLRDRGAGVLHLQGDRGLELFTAAIDPAPALLVCGAGPDAEPVVDWGAQLGWHVTVVDHRAAYVAPERFARARAVREVDTARLREALPLDAFDAAVVMSHHLTADGQYLAALAASTVRYVGLLGPAARRERLIAELGAAAEALRPRLRAPVGLDLGGRTPETIALSIVAEIQGFLEGRRGLPFSGQVRG
jgi:xanthine/CO dehydrogenase XdhC/CoxF family maturation factor